MRTEPIPPPGLGERVATDLAAHLPLSATLRVVPSQGLSDPAPDFKAIGAKLGVHYVITGAVSAQDEKVRVGVALVDTRHGQQVWQLHATEDRDRWPAVHEEFIHRATFAIHFQAVRHAGNEPVEPDMMDFPERLALERGRPTLIIPYVGRYREIGRNVVIAWKAARASARAVFDALPILVGADSVPHS